MYLTADAHDYCCNTDSIQNCNNGDFLKVQFYWQIHHTNILVERSQ